MKHVLVIPLKASSSDFQRVEFLMKYSGQIRNATLGTMIHRVEQLRRDKRWRDLRDQKKSKQRTDTYNQIKKEYRLSEFDSIRVTQKHAKESVWLPEHLDGRIITSIGKEIWTPVNLWLHGKAGKPRFTSANQRTLLSGNDQKAGLRYKKGYIVHSTKAINTALRNKKPLGEQMLKIRVDWESIPKKRRKYYQTQESNVKKVDLILTEGRKLEAHLIYDCLPYRSKDKVEASKENLNKQVSFDLGPSSLAFVSPDNNSSGIIQPKALLKKQIIREHKKRRRLQRSSQRSLQQTNPDCFKEDGQYIRGKKIKIQSNNYLEFKESLRSSYRKERKLVSEWHQNAAEQITSLGLELITEADTVKQWQEGDYGKSVTTLAPATLKQRIFHEAKVLREHNRLPERNTELNTYTTWLSQSCLCGQRVKKKLHERVHCCQNEDCLLYNISLHRDKFAALLGFWVKQLSGSTNSQGVKIYNEKNGVKKLLNETYHTQEHRTVAIELCSVGLLDHKPGNTQVSMSSVKAELGQVKTSSRQAKQHLSKPSRLIDNRGERVKSLNATDKREHNHIKLEKELSGV